MSCRSRQAERPSVFENYKREEDKGRRKGSGDQEERTLPKMRNVRKEGRK